MTTQTKTAHTEGPISAMYCGDPEGYRYQLLANGGDGSLTLVGAAITRQDAELFAAAPEMLKALEALLDITPFAKDDIEQQIRDRAHRAIQKARGGR